MTNVLEYLYRLSLESPWQWWMFFGPADAKPGEPPELSVHMLSAYILGLERGAGDSAAHEYRDFLHWLRDVKNEWPGQGWPAKFLADAAGDHRAAIAKFFEFVREYARLQRSAWFVEFNSHAQPSMILRGNGEPYSLDVRDPADRI